MDLHQLVVCAASDRYYEHTCPFDILWPDHPVVRALLATISRKTVQNLKIRVHDDAAPRVVLSMLKRAVKFVADLAREPMRSLLKMFFQALNGARLASGEWPSWSMSSWGLES
ncbi:uncharacterized protein K441DRAFT_654066 [Cenococcum geophilum 1.58]|uniref:uncharacterized protein n=1 Tax=Cenococcum geophilum 1.58 TaxID=794803 RepID=UPI00358FD62F|nr:hypothetical protein K441DRAFT_654066 [Cenococcum geophilum 1.58]